MKASIKILILAAVGVSAWYLSVFASGGFAEKKITAETKVTEITEFNKCGHSETCEFTASENLTGLSPEKAAEKLGCELKSFDSEKLIVSKTHDGLCKKHYVVKLENENTITVRFAESGNIKSSYPVLPSQFSETDLKRLKSGITVNSDAELSAVIEDYTS